MPVTFNHAIVFAHDKQQSASFFASLFDLPEPVAWGPFVSVQLDQGCLVQFVDADFEIQPQHYAFLVTEDNFDGIYRRIVDGGIEHWAEPQMSRPGMFNTNHGGPGVYFRDPTGHNLEALTSPHDGSSEVRA